MDQKEIVIMSPPGHGSNKNRERFPSMAWTRKQIFGERFPSTRGLVNIIDKDVHTICRGTATAGNPAKSSMGGLGAATLQIRKTMHLRPGHAVLENPGKVCMPGVVPRRPLQIRREYPTAPPLQAGGVL